MRVVSFDRRGSKVLFSTPVSCYHALKVWRVCVCRRGLLFERMFCDRNPARLPKSLQCSPVGLCPGPKINCYMGHYVQTNRECDKTKNWSPSAHQITSEHWGSESFNLAIPTACWRNFFFPRLDELDLGDIWFQQDGATAHTSRASMAVLREHFPERLISIRGDLEWPARSPDLAPCDFFCRVFWNPTFMSTVQGPYKTWRPTFGQKLPTYPLLCWKGSWQTPEIGLFSVWAMGGVTYLIWFLKLSKTKL